MRPSFIALSLAAALALSACGRDEPKEARPAGGGSSAAAQPQADTKTTPANIGQPSSTAEKREGANPVQQQVDPKERAQHRDFQQRGDAAGPKSPETAPKPGS